ncbi:hypothetical protein OPV22_035029 [Ensete ventricosum]|uniref:Conserved Oligomeric Golgi complex subunit 6 C-terminal domain-containing protein n=1 Tax=Ensete ventricosum TaxID=4639 RepID=A0AAV8PKG3_ENSVE|nr:hypothetical protein OPV22_035029 [Ensete ventricosum]
MTPPEIGDCGVSSANGGHRRTAKATAVPSSTDVSSLQCLPRATAVAACPRLQNQTPPPFCYLCAEQSILLNTSGDGECVQSGDIDVRPNVADSKEQASCLSMSEMKSFDFSLYNFRHQVPSQLSAGDDLVVHYGLRWVQAECKKLGDNDNPEDGFIRLWHLKGLIISYKLSYTLEFYCHTISDLLGRETALCNTRWLLEDAAQQTFFNILKGRGETLKVPSTGRG